MQRGNRPTSEPWPVGSRIKGRYEVRDIKYGGLATVYICFDPEFQMLLAVKTCQDKLLREREVADRFLNEAELWMRLEKHRNIVWAKWVDNINSRPCIFMEYIPATKGLGADLSGWIGRNELTLALSLSFGTQVCTGMIYAQRKFSQMNRPFVHRDLKPANIMITPDGTAKVTDFGLAKVVGEQRPDIKGPEILAKTSEPKHFKTRIGEVFGTPPYMAPEQWISSSELNVCADIYSFGCILYEMLASTPPFLAKNFNEYKALHLEASPKPISIQNKNVPNELEQLVGRCLEKSPSKRFRGFEEIRSDLTRILYNLTGQWLEWSDNPEPLDVADLSNIAMALLEINIPNEAIGYYDRILGQIADEISPEMVARVFNNRGNCHHRMGNTDKALTNYDLASRIDKTYDFPWVNAARIYQDIGNLEQALAYSQKAIKVNSNFPDSHLRQAEILILLGRYREAVDACVKAIALDPSHIRAYETRARAFAKLGDTMSADLDKAMV